MHFSSQILNHKFAFRRHLLTSIGNSGSSQFGKSGEEAGVLKSPSRQDIQIPNSRHHFSVSVVKMVPATEADRSIPHREGANLPLLLLSVQSQHSEILHLSFCGGWYNFHFLVYSTYSILKSQVLKYQSCFEGYYYISITFGKRILWGRQFRLQNTHLLCSP